MASHRLILSEAGGVSLWIPGRRTGRVAKTGLVSVLILLTVLGSIGTVLPGLVQVLATWSSPPIVTGIAQCTLTPEPPNRTTTQTSGDPSCSTAGSDAINRLRANANPVPDLSLPKTVVSSVDSLIGAGGVIQSSSENLTLYNSAMTLRLLGGAVPHDELLGSNHQVLSSDSSWSVEASVNSRWVPMLAESNNFTIIGTNSTGTYAVRTMRLGAGQYSGILKVTYKATTAGPLKWDLDFTAGAAGHYRLSLSWLNPTNRFSLATIERSLRTDYGGHNYTLSWGDVPRKLNVTTSVSRGKFSLFVDIGTLVADSKVLVDPGVVGTSSSPDSTAYTFQRKVFYEPKAGRYWVFYYDGARVKYASSPDGVNWSGPSPMPGAWPSLCDVQTCAPAVVNSGQTVAVASGNNQGPPATTLATDQSLYAGISYVVGSISGPTISWGSVKTTGTRSFTCALGPCQVTLGYRLLSVTVGSDGNLAFSSNWYLNVYPGPICSSGAYSESAVVVVYKGGQLVADRHYGCGSFDSEQDKSAVLPADSGGAIRVIYQFSNGNRYDLRTRLFYGSPSIVSWPPSQDSYVNSSSVNTSYGAKSLLWLRNDPNEQDYSYLQFGTSSAPEQQFSSAQLTLKFSQGSLGSDPLFLTGLEVSAANDVWLPIDITWIHRPGTVPGSKSDTTGFLAQCTPPEGALKRHFLKDSGRISPCK